MDNSSEHAKILIALDEGVFYIVKFIKFLHHLYRLHVHRRVYVHHRMAYRMASRVPKQVQHLRMIIDISDVSCINNLPMSRNAFARLCYLLEYVGVISDTKNVRICEQVAIFLCVLAHHKKTQIIEHDFQRSGCTVSKHFNAVLSALIRCHSLLLVTPEPVTQQCTDDTWKWFKGCLGALDVTYIEVNVRTTEKTRYRSRKGDIAVNVLGACDREMKFVYVLTGWEGSAADSRVLRDALTRTNGLKSLMGITIFSIVAT